MFYALRQAITAKSPQAAGEKIFTTLDIKNWTVSLVAEMRSVQCVMSRTVINKILISDVKYHIVTIALPPSFIFLYFAPNTNV